MTGHPSIKGAGAGEDFQWRNVTLLELGSTAAQPIADTDVVVAVLGPAGVSAEDRSRLAAARERAEIIMGIVTSDSDGAPARSPGLATLRDYADILAHVGTDRGAVDDVVAILTNGTAL